jgi:hypothetical protein
MWTCEHCGETVDEDDFEVCWRCSTPRGLPDLAPPPPLVDEPDDDKIAVFLALRRGIRTVAAHPVILVAALPDLFSYLVVNGFGVPAERFLADPTSLGWRDYVTLLPGMLLVAAASSGLATLLAYAAAKGEVSLADALTTLARRFPALLAAALVLPFEYLVIGRPRVVPLLLTYALVYVSVRLAFWNAAILVDGLGAIAALRRSWQLTRGNWWRLSMLGWMSGSFCLLLALAHVAIPAVPIPALLVVGVLLGPVGTAVLTSAYLQRIGVLPGPRPLPGTVGRYDAVAFPGS